MKTTKTSLVSFIFNLFLFLFVGIVMVDPTNKLFHIKEIVFGLLIMTTVVLQRVRFYKDVLFLYSTLILLALISVCMGDVFYGMDIMSSIPYFKALMFGMVFLSLSKVSVQRILDINYWVGLSLSIFITLLLISFFVGIFNFSGLIERMIASETVMVARRGLLGMSIPMFFYKTMPFCFFALIYALRKKKWLPAIIIMAPIFFGGSRTPMLMALAILAYMLYDRKSKYLRLFIGVIAVLSLVFLVLMLLSPSYADGGDEIKGGVASYLIKHSSLFGHGVGAGYWDPERRKWTTTTEMTYFEMLYQYGWLLFPFVLFIFLKPFFVMYRRQNGVLVKDFAVAYLLYLVNAGTNPLLINSTGMYVFACALTIAAKCKVRMTIRVKTKTRVQGVRRCDKSSAIA